MLFSVQRTLQKRGSEAKNLAKLWISSEEQEIWYIRIGRCNLQYKQGCHAENRFWCSWSQFVGVQVILNAIMRDIEKKIHTKPFFHGEIRIRKDPTFFLLIRSGFDKIPSFFSPTRSWSQWISNFSFRGSQHCVWVIVQLWIGLQVKNK